ncbi:MAG: aldose 1-epimerase family protein [Rhodoblastus sp.]
MSSLDLSCGRARLRLSQRGAEPLAWSVGDLDLLWQADPAVWAQTAPILFPVVGWTRNGEIRHRGRTYPLGLHGFAAGRDFAIVEQGADFARLRLAADDETRALYPFAFKLDAIYRLEAGALSWALEATNLGNEPMPYALGLHPGFRWPLAASVAPHAFLFDAPEEAEVPVIASGGLFSTERRAIPLEGRRLALTPELMGQEALCFLDIASTGAVFDNGAGTRLRVQLDDFPHLALWARPPAPFLCIEAWTGHGDPQGFAGELSDKPSMRLLAPGATARHAARFSLERPA